MTEYALSHQTDAIINAFYEVYNTLGYGFIEQRRGIPCVTHPKINVYYKGEVVGYYEADIICCDAIILELKAVSSLCESHELQLVNYLKATDIEVGLLLNFGPKPEVKRRVFTRYYRAYQQRTNKYKSAPSASSASEESPNE